MKVMYYYLRFRDRKSDMSGPTRIEQSHSHIRRRLWTSLQGHGSPKFRISLYTLRLKVDISSQKIRALLLLQRTLATPVGYVLCDDFSTEPDVSFLSRIRAN